VRVGVASHSSGAERPSDRLTISRSYSLSEVETDSSVRVSDRREHEARLEEAHERVGCVSAPARATCERSWRPITTCRPWPPACETSAGRSWIGAMLVTSSSSHSTGAPSRSPTRARRLYRAASLHDDLTRNVGRSPWVHAVVALWSDFEQGAYETDRCAVVHGSRLVDWLISRPDELDEATVRRLSSAVDVLARNRG
jgi:hypothetical protein